MSGGPERRGATLVAAAGAAAVVLVLTGEAVFTERSFFWRDLGQAVRPILEAAFTRGPGGGPGGGLDGWPFWSPFVSSGRPLLANPGHALFSPLTLLHAVLPFDAAMDLFVALHLVVAALAGVALARGLRLSVPACFVAGVAWALGGFMVSAANLYPTLAAAAWAPLTVLAALRAAARPSAGRCALLALALGVQAVGGQPEVVLFTVLAAAAWSVLAAGGGGSSRRLGRTALAFAVAGPWGMLLAAPQLLPSALLAGSTLRSLGFTGRALLYNSLRPVALPGIVLPRWGGHPLERLSGGFPGAAWTDAGTPYLVTIYSGLSVVLLAAVGVSAALRRAHGGSQGAAPAEPPARESIFVDRRRLARAAAATAALGVVASLGRHLPGVEAAVDAAPALLPFRYPVKALLLTSLALPVLAALGVEALRESLGRDRRLALLPVALALVVALDLSLSQRSFLPTIDRASLAEPPLVEVLREAAEDAGAAPGQWRLHHLRPRWSVPLKDGERAEQASFTRDRRLLVPPAGASFGVRHAFESAGDLLDLRPYFELTRELYAAPPATRAAALGRAGVLFVLAPCGAAAADGLVRLGAVRDDAWIPRGSACVFRVPGFRPRVELVREVAAAQGGGTAAEVVAAAVAGGPVLVEPHVPRGARDAAGTAAPGLATLVSEDHRSLVVHVRALEPTTLVVRDQAAPGWTATVDGTPARLLVADHAFRAVAVARGEHVVRFDYRPPGLVPGLACAGAGWLALIAAGLRALLRAGGSARRRRVSA